MSDFVIEKGILKKYTGTQKLVTIPGDVTCIGEKAFYGCSQVEHIDVPEGVTEIQSYAFLECTGLHSVSLPKSLRKIWGGAFRECSSLEHVDSPDGLPQASAMLFFKCSSLKKVQLSNCVTCIENDAFADCTSLEDISIPAHVTEIDMHAFQGCSALRSVKLPCSVTTIRWAAFQGCTNLEEILIPCSVTSIGEAAFADTAWLKKQYGFVIVNDILLRYTGDAENVVVPQGTKVIGCKAFAGCQHVKNITLPDSLIRIENYAFLGCTALERMDIPHGTTWLGKSVFDQCSNLHSIVIPSSISEIDGQVLGQCEHLRHLTVYGRPGFLDMWFSYSIFPQSQNMEWMCFPGAGIPASSARDKLLFLRGYLNHPDLYDEKNRVSYHYYMSAQRKRLLHDAVTNDDVSLFAGYEQEGVAIPPALRDELIDQAVQEKKTEALAWLLDFQNRTADRAKETQNKARDAEQEMSNPYMAKFLKKEWSWSEREDGTIQIEKYKGMASDVVIPPRVGTKPVTWLGECVFNQRQGTGKRNDSKRLDNYTLKSVTLPESLTGISEYALMDCRNLQEIAIPASVKWIGQHAFTGTPWLRGKHGPVIINQVLVAFAGNKQEIVIPEGVTSIADSAFEGHSGVHVVDVPASVKQIGNGVFRNCTGLRRLIVHGDVRLPAGWQDDLKDAADLKCLLLPGEIPSDQKPHIKAAMLNGFAEAPDLYSEDIQAVYIKYLSGQKKRLLTAATLLDRTALFDLCKRFGIKIPATLIDELSVLAEKERKATVLTWLKANQ